LGMMAAQQNKWEEAAPYLDRGLKLDPVDFPQAWYVAAATNFNLKKFDEAERNAREAQKLDPKHTNPRTDYLLALILFGEARLSGSSRASERLPEECTERGRFRQSARTTRTTGEVHGADERSSERIDFGLRETVWHPFCISSGGGV